MSQNGNHFSFKLNSCHSCYPHLKSIISCHFVSLFTLQALSLDWKLAWHLDFSTQRPLLSSLLLLWCLCLDVVWIQRMGQMWRLESVSLTSVPCHVCPVKTIPCSVYHFAGLRSRSLLVDLSSSCEEEFVESPSEGCVSMCHKSRTKELSCHGLEP